MSDFAERLLADRDLRARVRYKELMSDGYTSDNAVARVVSEEVTEAVTRLAIDVEKRLCELLGRPWTATGISIETLIADVRAKLNN